MRKVLKNVGILVMAFGIFLGIPQMMVSAAENVIDEEYGYITWSIRDGGCLYIEGTGDFSDKKVDTRAPWREYNYCITSAKVNVKGMTNASWMFEGLYCLEKVDLIEFDTSNVTNMEGMFNRCTDLVEIRFVDLDTSNVTNMKNMFKYCIGLKKLDLRSWDTGNVTNMSGMFSGCTELQTLAIDGWDTSNVVDMSYMFSDCRRINLKDLSNLDTSNVKNMSGMFSGGGFVSFPFENFNTQNVTTMMGMFQKCPNLKEITLNKNDTSCLRNMSNMFQDCPALEVVNLTGMNAESLQNISYMFEGCTSLEAIDFCSFKNSPLTNVEGLFANCSSLKNVELAGIDTSRVTSLESMFLRCKSLEYLDVSCFDTGNVENMNFTFAECSMLKELDVSGFDTRNVISFDHTFAYCELLETLDVSGFSTEKASNMSGMFLSCASLIKLDVSGFNTGNVTTMENMFEGCSSLKELDVSNFDTSNVKYMGSMFAYCLYLEALDLSNFDIENVTDVTGMLYGCLKVKYLDLSNFDLNDTDGYEDIVSGCPQLKKLAVPANLLWESSLPVYCWFPVLSTYNKWTWSLPDGREIEYLPQKLTKSIVITRNIPIETYFQDAYANQWYTDYVQYVFDNDLMSGNEYRFEPNQPMTRGMVVQTLYNMEGKPEVTDYKACTELKDVYQDWYTDAVCWAYNEGIATGYDDSKTFKVYESVTREQLATFLYRYAEFKDYECSQVGDLANLKNAWKVSSYAEDAVKWAVGAGIISGLDIVKNGVVTAKDLAPQGTATRAQMAAILQRFCDSYIPLEVFEWSGHSYALFNNCQTWEEAKEFCESKGGHLAVISSEEENETLYTFLKENGYGNAFFGLSATEEENWNWVNGEKIEYTNWNAQEPSKGTDENYAMFFWMYEDGTWNDGAFCENIYDGGKFYICEWE